MATVILIENDIARYLRDKCKPKGLKLDKALPCKVTLEVDSDAYKALDDDPLLLAKVTEAASAKYYDLVNGMVIKLRQFDAAYVKSNSKSDRVKLIKAYEGYAQKQFKQFAKDGKKAAEAAWAEVAKTKAEYRKYQVKAGIGLAIDGLSVVGGVVSAVGTGGFALIVGLYGIVKTLIGAAMKIYKLAIDADKMKKRVTKNLKKIQKSFDKKKKELSGAKDSGKAFINSLLGADFIPTISAVKADNDQYKSKVVKYAVLGGHKNTLLGDISPFELILPAATKIHNFEVLPAGELVPHIDSDLGQAYVKNGLIAVQGNSIDSIIASVNTLLLNFQKENNPDAGSIFRILDRVAKMTDHLLSVSEALQKSNILVQAEGMMGQGKDYLGALPKLFIRVNDVIDGADEVVKQTSILIAKYSQPELIVEGITDGKIPPMLDNVNASLTVLQTMLNDIHAERDQLVITVHSVQQVLNKLDKTLQGLNNNPLLKGGIKKDAKGTGIEMND
ncbi:MAG: hypothetical protein MJK04_26175 [Psychrosphaera sp.]|nr:hypothetical protein [Psychrosphaera sp.]